MKPFLAALAAALLLATPSGADTIRLAYLADNPPFSYADENGNPAGFEPALGTEICQRMELECAGALVAEDSLLTGLAEGRHDVAMGAIPMDRELPGGLDRTQAYMYPDVFSVIGHKGHELTFGVGRLAVLPGRDLTFWFDQNSRTPVPYPTMEAALDGLENGEVEGIAGERRILAPVIEERGDTYGYIYEVRKFDPGFGAVLREGDSDLRFAFEDGIFEMSEDGSLRALVFEWFGYSAEPG